MSAAASVTTASLKWRLLVAIGVVSVITMPVTAIWFLFLGFMTFAGTAIYAAVSRAADQATDVLQTGASIGIGLLLGPTAYLSMAALT